jgi:O-antigen/teichoic acid export membrane protein
VALGWALYGLLLVLVVMAGRAKVSTRTFPAALAGLVVNAVLLVVLVPGLGIAGAGIALCGAYVVMLAIMYGFSRRLFAVQFEWRRLALVVTVIGSVAVAGELLLPTSGWLGFVERAAALALIPAGLVAARFFGPGERARIRALARRIGPAG